MIDAPTFPSVPGLKVSAYNIHRSSRITDKVASLECHTCGLKEVVGLEVRSTEQTATLLRSWGWVSEHSEYGMECVTCRNNPYRNFQRVNL